MRFEQIRFKPHSIAVCLLTCCITVLPAFSDIFEWEYIDPLQPELGKQESTTLVPGGAGVNAVPGANLVLRDLTKAYLIGANLTNAALDQATLADADLTNAMIDGTRMRKLTSKGFTAQQLYSTATYQAGGLSGVILDGNDMSGWDFAGLDMSGASLAGADLTGAMLNGSDLTSASLAVSTLANADLSGAVLTRADLILTTSRGFTELQLQSSASYQAGNLSGIKLGRGNDLSGWDFSNQNLTGASFSEADSLAGANFAGAVINDAEFYAVIAAGFTEQQLASTASYQADDLQGIYLRGNDLSGWDFSGQNLTGASVRSATLLATKLLDAVITGADFGDTVSLGLTQQQLATTANYKAGNLTGIDLSSNDMSGWDFSGLDLSGAVLTNTRMTGSDLSGANLVGANLGGASVWSGADLSEADLTGANMFSARLFNTDLAHAILTDASLQSSRLIGTDTRGAINLTESQIDSATVRRNLIRPDGTIREGLLPLPGEVMWVRDDDGGSTLTPIPITVQTAFDIDPDATLRFIIEDPGWGSTILFDATVGTANLGGTLGLAMKLDDGLTPTDLLGSTFQLFDWTGVSFVGGFDAVVLDPAWFAAGLSIDRSRLMTTGEIKVVPLIGDLDGDGFVGIADLNIVLTGWNENVTPGDLLAGDVDGDGFVGIVDLNLVLGTWNSSVPPVTGIGVTAPEPGGAALLALGGLTVLSRRTG